jgi:hypothetical protein
MLVELDDVIDWLNSLKPSIIETEPFINTYLIASLNEYLEEKEAEK